MRTSIMAEVLKLKSLTFLAGARSGSAPLHVETPSVTLLVGPNNSGKSLSLREIETWCQGKPANAVVIGETTLTLPDTASEVRAMLVPFEAQAPEGQFTQVGQTWFSRATVRKGEPTYRMQVSEHNLKAMFDERDGSPDVYNELRSIFVQPFVVRLDGRTRFDLMDDKPTGPLERAPENHLWALFASDERREQVRAFTEAAFNAHFVVDPTGMTTYRARLSNRKPDDKTEEQALDVRARTFHGAAPLVSGLGDGVRASIGLVSAVMSLPYKILLVDEPEAFLHPTLARRMGRTLAKAARERDASMVIATHSAELLMGCLQASPDLRLVRLTYQPGASTARSIDTQTVSTLMQDPLLRSANALRALFHRAVVVTEADADRAFYEEINVRLLEDGRGIDDAIFLNAQNWQTILRIVEPLRQLGIPAAAIFDLDVIMSSEFAPIWKLIPGEGAEKKELQATRSKLKDILTKLEKKACKEKGVDALDSENRDMAKQFIARMGDFGIFFVSVGELESWLANIGISRSNKAHWITAMFERLGSDPTADDYVRSGDGDVWNFLTGIEHWIANPNRLGIP